MLRPTLALASLALLAAPALAADYTDHAGRWSFTDPTFTAQAPPFESILLKLADGSGFTAFVEPRATLGLGWQRPPTMAFQCYSALGTGDVLLRGEPMPVHGDCALTQELVDGQRRFVVRFTANDVPWSGLGVYDVRPIGS